MKTTQFTKARTFVLMAFALGISAAAAYPAQAARLIVEQPGMGSGMGSGDYNYDNSDCSSRQEVKWEFKERLTHINVSKTGERYFYLVSGYASKKAIESLDSGPQDLLSTKPDRVRYVFLYDACDHRIAQQLQPPLKAM